MKYFLKIKVITTTSLFFLLLSFLPGGSLFAQEPDTTLIDGLVSYWPLDEESGVREDMHGENDLSDHNTVGYNPTCMQGGCADFESDNLGYLSIPDSEQVDLDFTSDWTITTWFKLESQTGNSMLWNKDNVEEPDISVKTFAASFTIEDKFRIYVSNGTTQVTDYNTEVQTINLGEWYFIAYVYDASVGEVDIYFSSESGVVLIDTLTGLYTEGNINDGTGSFNIGALSYFDGLIDEVGVWNRTLSADEVALLYNNSEGLPYERFDEGASDSGSSVLFLPGITGSRLYIDNSGDERKLWESVWSADLEKLRHNTLGTSARSDIYTRDIVETIRPLTGWWDYAEGYSGFISFMDGLVADDTINEWRAVPYDWRLATDELFKYGEDMEDGNISYLTGEQGVPYIISELEALAENSATGKVTIVAHSNGGLVTKNLIKHLEDNNRTDLLEKIDTVVLVAVPQLGTPKTIGELLHGTTEVAQIATREAMENMPGAYGLLPSSLLYPNLSHPVVEFTDLLKNIPGAEDIAGTNITNKSELDDFILGDIIEREEPDEYDVDTPNVLNELLVGEAETMHTDIDIWEFPESIRVVEVVGTGLPTPSGVKYGDCTHHNCTGGVNYLNYEWSLDTLGDGTVLVASADGGDADETYYVALNRYSEAYRHGTILSAPNMQEFIAENVLGTSEVLPIHMGTDVGDADNYPRFELRAYSPVDVHLYQNGKHTGITDTEVTKMGREFEIEIPGSYYEEWGTVKYIGGSLESEIPEIEIKSIGEGTFTLALDLYNGNTLAGSFVFPNIPVEQNSKGEIVLPETGTPELHYDMDGDGQDIEIISPNEEEEGSELEQKLQALKDLINSGNLPRFLEKWLKVKVKILEKFIERDTERSLRLAEKIIDKTLNRYEKYTTKN